MTTRILCIGVGLILSPVAYGLDFVRSARADLDGNGTADTISIASSSGSGERYRLSVNGAVADGAFPEAADGFAIVDLDARDRFREIAVHTPGASDDHEYDLYSYDGTRLKKMAHLQGVASFPGGGVVLTDAWQGFWSRRDKYALQSDRTLKIVPQEFHYVGVTGRVKTSFPLYSKMEAPGVLANLAAGSTITVVLARLGGQPGANWYMVRSASGLLGWAQEGVIFENVDGLPLAD